MSTRRRPAKEAGTAARDTAEDPGQTAETFAEDVARSAETAAAAAGDALAEGAGSLREALAGTAEALAGTLRRAAGRAGLGPLHEDLSARLSDGVEALCDRSLHEIGADLQASARRNPGAWILGAAVAGFALGCLMRPAPGRRR